MLTLKFGGTSMGSARRMLDSAAIMIGRAEQDRISVVVSAVAGISNKLQESIDKCSTGTNPEEFISFVRETHSKICNDITAELKNFDSKAAMAKVEVVLKEYLSEARAVKNIPVLQMISKSQEDIVKEARKLKRFLTGLGLDAEIGIEACESQIGGGSLPLERISSKAVTIKPKNISTAELEVRMRFLPVPIIPRTLNDKIVLDVRTIGVENFEYFRQLKDICK